ncbi:hypothetical protein PG989_016402 [Apiospora arundinis]
MATLHPTKSTTPVPERTEEDNQRLFQLYKGWTLTRDGQLNPKEPKEQDLINTLIKRFDKTAFQQKLVNWIVNYNQSFSIVNDQDLRDIFNYLNPSVEITKANITDVTVFEGLHTAAKEHEVWRRRGTVGKWHNFAVEVAESPVAPSDYEDLGGEQIGYVDRYAHEGPLVYGAAVLHPAYRWALFDDLWGDDDERRLWITKAREMVQDLWEREYRDLEVDDPEIELPANKRLKTSEASSQRGAQRSED